MKDAIKKRPVSELGIPAEANPVEKKNLERFKVKNGVSTTENYKNVLE